MDYKDFKVGYTEDSFWLKSKKFLIENLAQKVSHGQTNLRILNIGAGMGGDLEILAKFGRNYVLDVEAGAVDSIDDNLCEEKKVADACDIPYGDNLFDLVIASDVLEHIKDDKKAVSEVYRVLKHGGTFIFMVPAFQFLFSSHDKALGHYRRYSKETVKNLIGNFRNLKIFYWNSLLLPPTFILRLMKKKSEPKIDYIAMPNFLNFCLFKIISIDNFLIKKGISPFIGMSLVGYCQKKQS
ncbi:class I SAM-dependent methyltransferase [Candidatus Parcubacteria bacterium]|nr:MAG: class I SAM-dependent methyltransferase [Candidatus Parcubacteria bacterium]